MSDNNRYSTSDIFLQPMRKICVFVSIAALSFCLSIGVVAQSRQLTAEDYARAEKMLAYNTAPLIDRSGVRPTWLPDGRFWYQVLNATGREYVIVDPATGTKRAGATLEAIGVTAPGGGPGRFGDPTGAAPGVRSPDGKKEVFIKDWNLYVRDVATKQEKQLTTDGIKDFGYATDNAGWRKSNRPVVIWSPDSRKVATFQQDQRHVSDMYLVTTNVGAPKLEAWKYPLPQDKEIAKIHRVVIDVEAGTTVRFKMEPDDHRGTLSDDISTGDMRWSDDAATFAFISSSRDHKVATLRVANVATGDFRRLFEERLPGELGTGPRQKKWG